MGRLDLALKSAKEGYQVVKDYRYGIAGKLAYNAGFFSHKLDYQEEALYYFLNAARIFQEKKLKAICLKKASDICLFLGDYELGVSYAQQGIDAVYGSEDLFELADNFNGLGLNQLELKNYAAAEEAFLKAEIYYNEWLKLGGGKDLEMEWALALNQGNVYNSLRNPSEAIVNYRKAVAKAKQSGDRLKEVAALSNLGWIYQKSLTQIAQAIAYYSAASSIADKYLVDQNDVVLAKTFGNYGQSLSTDNQIEKSEKMFERALKVYPQWEKGSLELVPQKDVILEIIREYGFTLLKGYSLSHEMQKLLVAQDKFTLADRIIDYMRREQRGKVSKLFWRETTRDLYEKAIEASFLSGSNENGYFFLEKTKAVLLTDQLNELGASALLVQHELEHESQLKSKVKSLLDKLGESSDDQSVVANLREQLTEAQQQLETFIKNLEKTNPHYYAYKYDNKVPTIEEVRSTILQNGQTLLSYFVGDSAVYGLAIGPQQTIFKKLDVREYNRLTSAFQRLIVDRNMQNSNFQEYLKVSSALYRLLVEPFSIPEGARVVISPDGVFLPFGAFSKSDKQPDFLVNHYAFSYAYSAVVLSKTVRKPDNRWFSGSFLGMAPVTFSAGLHQSDLVGSDVALRNIDRRFLNSSLATGADATRAAFVNGSSGHRIVQLFTHASADSTGSIPTLYFADSTLRLNELSLPGRSLTQLLVLSACQTGVGKNQRGEGVFSLARGFAGLGIPSVLTTLWSVENEPVYAITEGFYDQLAEGLPLDLALQKAQIAWLQTAAKSGQLPYAWAGMVVVGNTEPINTGPSAWKVYAIVGLLVVLGMAAVAHRRSWR